MKDVHCKKNDHTGLRFKHEVLSSGCAIEKNNKIKVVKTKNKNHVDISSFLSKLDEAESNNSKNNYKFATHS